VSDDYAGMINGYYGRGDVATRIRAALQESVPWADGQVGAMLTEQTKLSDRFLPGDALDTRVPMRASMPCGCMCPAGTFPTRHGEPQRSWPDI
jgi:hypothetical protein